MSRTPNSSGSYVSHGRVGRAPAPRGVEDSGGLTASEREYDELLAQLDAEDIERERVECQWPSDSFGTVSEDDRIEAANTDFPSFDPADGDTGIYKTFRDAA
jgi:hypothetical protein